MAITCLVDVDLLNVHKHSVPASQGIICSQMVGFIRLAETMDAFGSHDQNTELHTIKLV